jgi:hypothetical protein
MASRASTRHRGARLRPKAAAGKPERARRRFRRFFPGGFQDPTYLDWERDYKVETHERWEEVLDRDEFQRLLRAREFSEIAARAVRVEQRSRHSMIFSFEKMALRDAVKSADGARTFAQGLFDVLHGGAPMPQRFADWVRVVDALPRKQTRVLTWPLVTVFGFIAQPGRHIFLKPTVAKRAAESYGFDLQYRSRPSWETYARVLEFAAHLKRDLSDMKPRDMIVVHVGARLRRIRLALTRRPTGSRS